MTRSTCKAECLKCGAFVQRDSAEFCADWLLAHLCTAHPVAPSECNICGSFLGDVEKHVRWHGFVPGGVVGR